MTKWQLWSLLTTPNAPTVNIRGVTGIVASIEREDGSGHSFNVVLNTKNGKRTVYVRTVD